MASISQKIAKFAEESPEGTALYSKAFTGECSRNSADQALSRLARDGTLLRICQGVYMRPVPTRFGNRAPSKEKVIPALSDLWNETIVTSGSHAANRLGLTTQVPIRSVYLTTGRDRQIKLGEETIELRHAPTWKLVAPNRPSGDAIRALEWLGTVGGKRQHLHDQAKLNPEDLAEMATPKARMPEWLAGPINALNNHA